MATLFFLAFVIGFLLILPPPVARYTLKLLGYLVLAMIAIGLLIAYFVPIAVIATTLYIAKEVLFPSSEKKIHHS